MGVLNEKRCNKIIMSVLNEKRCKTPFYLSSRFSAFNIHNSRYPFKLLKFL